MAELAKERGIKALDADEGSMSIFLAPAGANKDEKLLLSKGSLAGRFVFKFLLRDAKENKKFDPSGVGKRRAAKNLVRNPVKTGKEIWYLSKKESTYSKLGELGLKPAVVVFPDDVLQPQRLNQKTTDAYVSGEGDYSLSGWSSAIGGLRRDTGEGEDAWLGDYRHAGHNDHARHPEDVAKMVLGIFDRRMDPSNVDHIIEANRKYLEGQVEVIPDASAMTIEEFRVYIHELAQADEQGVQAVVDSLQEVDDILTAHQHEVSHSMVELTVLTSELSQELDLTLAKRRWAQGYKKDRQQ
jgi:hypothetical protein